MDLINIVRWRISAVNSLSKRLVPPNPLKTMGTPMSASTLATSTLIILYVGLSIALFFQWIAPSLDGRSDLHIGADSASYVGYAEMLREGRADPDLIAAMTSFPNTILFPVFVAFVIKSTFLMMVANYAMAITAIILLGKAFSFSLEVFLTMMLLNATTTISLLTVNKEIVDLLAVAIFFYARQEKRTSLLILALLLATLNRFEVAVVMLAFMLLRSRFNPLRQRRLATIVLLVFLLSVSLPMLLGNNLEYRFSIGSEGALSAWFNRLEISYLYWIAVIPKIGATFFSELINVRNWRTLYGSSDIANTYILLSNNLASAILFFVLLSKRKFNLSSDVVYFSMIACVIMSVSLSKQPRYLYFAYALFCLQSATQCSTESPLSARLHSRPHWRPLNNEG